MVVWLILNLCAHKSGYIVNLEPEQKNSSRGQSLPGGSLPSCPRNGRAHCHLDDVTDQFTQDLEDFFEVQSPPDCHPEKSVFYVTENTVLHVNRTSLMKQNNGSGRVFCYYRAIKGIPTDDFDFIKGKRVYFKGSVNIKDDFIRVRCRRGQNVLAEDAMTFVPLKSHVEKRCVEKSTKRKGDGLTEAPSIVLLGIDSVSRASFRRRMPKTRRYLTQNLGGIELAGYNKVHDNTLVNLMPFLSGKFLEETRPFMNRLSKYSNYYFDDCPFIWQNLSIEGYRTMLAEDRPDIATFQYRRKRGFKKQPTDYYLRPFFLELFNQPTLYNSGHSCVGPRSQPNLLLDYLVSFTKQFRDEPHFSLTFQVGQSHGDVNGPTWLDKVNLEAIQKMEREGSLNNTILIMFSDHGLRFGYSRITTGATVQERLPFLVIVTPKWFRERHADLQHTLEENAYRLSTPFDIHATMVDILGMLKGKRSIYTDRGQSLFTPIPLDRTCSDASIGLHWCGCHDWTELPNDSPVGRVAALAAVDDLNNIMKVSNYSPPCLQLSLGKLLSAVAWKEKGPVLFHKDILSSLPRSEDISRRQYCSLSVMVTLQLTPGNDIFQVTMCKTVEGIFKNYGFVSRLTKVRRLPKCISEDASIMFCQCP